MLFDLGLIPAHVLARGLSAQTAYLRALESGYTSDKRVKVLIIGQDRVGKTSLGKSLKGELFDENQPSTNGVEMDLPMKNVGEQPWKNYLLPQNTTVLDHKCAVFIGEDLQQSTTSREQKNQQMSEESTVSVADRQMRGSKEQMSENQKESKLETNVEGLCIFDCHTHPVEGHWRGKIFK